MELTREQLDALYDLTVVSDDGQTMGPVGHIYLDDQTQQATWITAKTGLFGLREVFIPFQGARVEPEAIKVRYTRDYIMDAPRFDSDGHISDAEQDELFRYFRVRRPQAPGPPLEGGPAPTEPAGPPVRDEAGPPVGDEAGPLSDREPAPPEEVGSDWDGGELPEGGGPEPTQAETLVSEGPEPDADPPKPQQPEPDAETGSTDDRA